MSGYATGSDNQITTDGTWTYTYDNVGDIVEKSKGSGLETWYYTYDTLNRLVSIEQTTNGTTAEYTVTYTYDVYGNLMKEQQWQSGGSTTTTYSVYDQGQVWADLNSGYSATTRYVWGGPGSSELYARIDVGVGLRQISQDALGSVRDVWDGTGVLDHVNYTVFGLITTETNWMVGGFILYDGLREDRASGTVMTTWRTLLVSLQRWMQPDPSGFGGADGNLYRDCGNDPTNGTDPTGLKSKAEWQAEADAKIKADDGLTRNLLRTTAYAEMYRSNPDLYKWAGMAALASEEVGAGMDAALLAEMQFRNAGPQAGMFLRLGASFFLGAPDPATIYAMLSIGNAAVYEDIYWQHLAYSSPNGGIKEIDRLYKAGELADEPHDAWHLIEDGKQLMAAGKRDEGQEKVWEGNRKLLHYEQYNILQKQLWDKYQGEGKWAGGNTASPIPYGEAAGFSKIKPGGNIANADDRWDWIDNHVLKDWRKWAEEHPEEVEAALKKLIDRKPHP